MKLKTLLIPLVGLTGITSVVPLTVSCGKKTIYDSPINLKNFIENRKDFKRLTERYTKTERISQTEVINEYISAIQQNQYVLDDDIFESIALSDMWDEEGNSVEGSLQFTNISAEKCEKEGMEDKGLISVTAKLDHAKLKLKDSILIFVNEIGFDGEITFTKVPFDILYHAGFPETKSSWRIEFATSHLAELELWSISVNGYGKIGDIEGAVSDIWDSQAVEDKILGYFIAELLDLICFDILYFKGILLELE